MMTLVPLTAVPPALVDSLLDAAFGAERRARTAYRIREGMSALEGSSLAALDEEGYLAATIQTWPVALRDGAGRAHPLVMVGPVAVAPPRQGEGFGKALMAASLAALDAGHEAGAPPLPLVMIGDPDYYERWDFTAAFTAGWRCPGPWEPHRLLVRAPNAAILPREGLLGPWTV